MFLFIMEENPDDYIEISFDEEGDMFSGTRDQFRDNFFDNASDGQIVRWCMEGCGLNSGRPTLKIRDEVINYSEWIIPN